MTQSHTHKGDEALQVAPTAEPGVSVEAKTVTESIYAGKSHTIPMALVQHIERRPHGQYMVVMKSSTYNADFDDYNNAPCLDKDEGPRFMAAWCRYRAELEAPTLMDHTPSVGEPQGEPNADIESIRQALQTGLIHNGTYSALARLESFAASRPVAGGVSAVPKYDPRMMYFEKTPGTLDMRIEGLSMRQIKDIFEQEYGALMWSEGTAYPDDNVKLQFTRVDLASTTKAGGAS